MCSVYRECGKYIIFQQMLLVNDLVLYHIFKHAFYSIKYYSITGQIFGFVYSVEYCKRNDQLFTILK